MNIYSSLTYNSEKLEMTIIYKQLNRDKFIVYSCNRILLHKTKKMHYWYIYENEWISKT